MKFGGGFRDGKGNRRVPIGMGFTLDYFLVSFFFFFFSQGTFFSLEMLVWMFYLWI